jgi:hypothetical protein
VTSIDSVRVNKVTSSLEKLTVLSFAAIFAIEVQRTVTRIVRLPNAMVA